MANAPHKNLLRCYQANKNPHQYPNPLNLILYMGFCLARINIVLFFCFCMLRDLSVYLEVRKRRVSRSLVRPDIRLRP